MASREDVASADTVAGGEGTDAADASVDASARPLASAAVADTLASGATRAAVDASAQTLASGATQAAVDASAPTLASGAAPDEDIASANASGEASGAAGGRPSSRPGETYGSFEVLEQLGAGGMGVVFAARDPDLDRKVAIKVLHSRAGAGQAQVRLLREAQAMAQLSHPNVITVHQVGTRADQVFVVMEYVDGGTLRDWVDREPRRYEAILGAYREAGAGLAAAHRAGLVHRDFKPDNVLVRADGRVLVTDFGLVASAGEAVGTHSGVATGSGSGSKLDVRLTRTGDVMGTPYYMAPEQHVGERADARADQYAFCVSLYEALYGQRPFDKPSYKELLAVVMRGKLPPPPAAARVPPWIHAVLARGMRVDPDDRFAEMDQLLAALGRDPAIARRRRVLVAGAALAMIGAIVLAVILASPRDPRERCRAAGARIAEVWNGTRRAALRARLAGTGAVADAILGGLDRYGRAWARERVAACEATHVEGAQSEALLDRRMFCLDRPLGALGALVERLEGKGGPALAPAAVEAIGRLPRVEACRQGERLGEIEPPAAAKRAAVEALSRALDRAVLQRQLGEFARSRALADKTLADAIETGYPPLIARAHYVAGFAADRLGQNARAEQAYREAIRLATQAKAHHLEAEAWLSLIYLVGHNTGRAQPALAMAPAAEAAVQRAGNDATLRGRLEGNLGLIELSNGAFERAREHLRASLEIFERAYGADDLDTAIARNNLAMLLERMGKPRRAYRELQQVLRVREARLGADHPSIASALNDMGNAAESLGDHAAARRHLERALTIRQAALGKTHPRTANTHNNLAIVLGELGEIDRAIEHARAAVAITERAFGPQHDELAGPLNTLGNQLRAKGEQKAAWEAFARGLANVELHKGKDALGCAPMVENLARIMVEMKLYDRALEFIDRALAIRERVQGARHPDVINAVALRGWANLEAERTSAATKDFERQRTLAMAARGAQHVDVGQAEYNLGIALAKAGAHARAAAHLSRALAIYQRGRADPRSVALARFELAQALWQAQQERRRALELARQARSDFVALGRSGADDVKSVERWLGGKVATD